MDVAEFRKQIVHHTQLGKSIRAKLKRMLVQLHLPDAEIERCILNYIGVPKFPFYSFTHKWDKSLIKTEKL